MLPLEGETTTRTGDEARRSGVRPGVGMKVWARRCADEGLAIRLSLGVPNHKPSSITAAGLQYIVMAYVVMAYVVRTCVVMAYVVMAYVVRTCAVMAYVVMACVVGLYSY